MKLIVKVILIGISLIIISCTNNIKFDKKKWSYKEDFVYEYREAMLNDLIANYNLNGLTYKQLNNLLGKPEKLKATEKNTIYYTIDEEYGADIDPVYIKYLKFKIDNDSTVISFKVEELNLK